MAALMSGAYARIRKQFDIPISDFEGIEEPLARIGGRTYRMDAARKLTLVALDQGEKPAVLSAILKANLTDAYLCRATLTGADLRKARLLGADLTNANLSGANLLGADLHAANLSTEDLTNADLSGALLFGVVK